MSKHRRQLQKGRVTAIWSHPYILSIGVLHPISEVIRSMKIICASLSGELTGAVFPAMLIHKHIQLAHRRTCCAVSQYRRCCSSKGTSYTSCAGIQVKGRTQSLLRCIHPSRRTLSVRNYVKTQRKDQGGQINPSLMRDNRQLPRTWRAQARQVRYDPCRKAECEQ